ncbi:MAG: hypothetical protein V7724_05245 [Sediminicola sp.]
MKKGFLFLMFVVMTTISVSSCRDQKSDGEKIEDGIEEVGDDIEEGAEEVEDEIDDATDDN